jgi:hypothetical protein
MTLLLLFATAGIFAYVQGPAILDHPLWQSERPHLRIPTPSVLTKAPHNIATDALEESFGENYPKLESSSWLNYRRRPVTSSFALLEPQANVRLLAPQADAVDLNSFGTLRSVRRSETLLDLSDTNSAIPVSATKTSDSKTGLPGALPRNHAALEKANTLWPYAQRLVENLQSFDIEAADSKNIELGTWSKAIQLSLETLRACQGQEIAMELDRLQQLATIGLTFEPESNPPSSLDESRMQIAHSIIRRLAVWKAVWECVAYREVATERPSFDLGRMAAALERVQAELPNTGDKSGWTTYLMLEDLQRMVNGENEAMVLAGQTAQVVLTRITSGNIQETQRQFLDSTSVRELAASIHPLAISPVDYARLLADVETVESDTEHRSYQTLVDAMQSLRFADDAKQVAVSNAIDTFYRNANVRIAISQKFVNRLLPQSKTIQRPVRQTVLGADTRGNSNVATNIGLQLVPDDSAWRMRLDVDGKIQSQTRSARGPATFFNSSDAIFEASRAIRVTPQGIQVEGVPTQVDSKDALRGVETAYDGLPFIGELIRYKAKEEFKEKRGPARRIMQRSIASQTDAEIDKLLDKQIKQAETNLENRLLGPLRNLNLNPMIKDLQTTQERLIARYRIASDNALAASSPRPQAPSDAMISIQLHQSALNNSFSSFGLSNQEWTLLELAQKLAIQFGQEPIEQLPADVPSDVRIRFEGQRPVLVEFRNGRLELTLRVALLTQPGRIELNDFVVRTSYIPRVDGLDAELNHEGAPSIDGERISFRERLPLRAIFGKIFTSRSTIALMNSTLKEDPRANGLAISQVILEQGWMAVAVSEDSSPHVALLRDQRIIR